MNAALGLADQGFPVVLVEKEEKLGGMGKRLTPTIEGKDVGRMWKDRLKRDHPMKTSRC